MTFHTRQPLPPVGQQDQITLAEILQAVSAAADQDPVVADQLRVHVSQVQRLMHGRGHPTGPWDALRWGPL